MRKKDPSINNYPGLYGEAHVSLQEHYLFAERIETRSIGFDWSIQAHTHPGILQVFLVETGAFELLHGSGSEHHAAPFLTVIPSSIVHGFRFGSHVRGWIISISELRFAALWRDAGSVSAFADQMLMITRFEHPYSTDVISGLMAAVEREQHIQDNEQPLMLQACLQQLFLVIRRLIETSDEHDAESGSAAGHLRKLKQIIQRKAGLVTVEELAEQMNLSAAHLNRISRQLTGLSVSGLIADQVVVEAKKLLLYTNLTVAEIGYKLNFDYPNYFARFFRLHTGASPKAFRSRKTT